MYAGRGSQGAEDAWYGVTPLRESHFIGQISETAEAIRQTRVGDLA